MKLVRAYYGQHRILRGLYNGHWILWNRNISVKLNESILINDASDAISAILLTVVENNSGILVNSNAPAITGYTENAFSDSGILLNHSASAGGDIGKAPDIDAGILLQHEAPGKGAGGRTGDPNGSILTGHDAGAVHSGGVHGYDDDPVCIGNSGSLSEAYPVRDTAVSGVGLGEDTLTRNGTPANAELDNNIALGTDAYAVSGGVWAYAVGDTLYILRSESAEKSGNQLAVR